MSNKRGPLLLPVPYGLHASIMELSVGEYIEPAAVHNKHVQYQGDTDINWTYFTPLPDVEDKEEYFSCALRAGFWHDPGMWLYLTQPLGPQYADGNFNGGLERMCKTQKIMHRFSAGFRLSYDVGQSDRALVASLKQPVNEETIV